MDIRSAVPADAENFMVMAEDFVADGRKEISWGPKTATMFRNFFDGLVSGSVRGAIFIAAPSGGFAAAIEIPHETPWGFAASGWGIFVAPKARGRGLGRLLHLCLCEELKLKGFDVLVTGADSEVGAMILQELKPVSTYGYIDLKEALPCRQSRP